MFPRLRARTATGAVAAAMLLAACAGGEPTTDTAGAGTSDAPASDAPATDAPASDATSDAPASDAPASDAPASDAPVSDAPAGEDAAVLAVTATAPDGSVFSIDDHAGAPVFVETFATWCSTCRRQLGSTQQAAVEAGDDAVFLILSVETNLDPAQLAEYAEDNGFTDLRFGVLDEHGLVAFEQAFGRSVLNAPSTPKFRVSPDGAVSELTTGLESVEEILATLPSS